MIQPTLDRVLVKEEEGEDTSAGGIVLPESAQQTVTRGAVVAVGPGKVNQEGLLVKPQVEVGETVVWGKYSGTEIEDAGDKFKILSESELLAVVE